MAELLGDLGCQKQREPRRDAAAIRLMASAAALLITLAFMAATGGWSLLAEQAFFAYIAWGFVTSWSLWLLISLWRQLRTRAA